MMPGHEHASSTPRRSVGRWIVGVCLALLVVAYLVSGFYVIEPNEEGVVRRFGKVVSTTIDGHDAPWIAQPGPHYRLPWPMTRLDRVRPTETKTMTVGFEKVDELLGLESDPQRAEFITGDQNLMRLRVTIQYTVADPVGYLFTAADPGAIVAAEAESCLSRAVASVGVDELIGSGRVRVNAAVRDALDREIARHCPGVRVGAVSLQAPTPPNEVADAFNNVQSAKAERHRLVLEAEAYRNNIVTGAYGDADQRRRAGAAYQKERVDLAEGEAIRFADLYEQYRAAKEVTRLRLYIETMEEILPRVKKVFVDADSDGAPVDLGLFNTNR